MVVWGIGRWMRIAFLLHGDSFVFWNLSRMNQIWIVEGIVFELEWVMSSQ